MKELKSKVVSRMATVAIFSALVGISGFFLVIPIAGGAGYLNFSDVFIILVACLVDPISGMLVGIIGGSLIDLFSGYAVYLPFTIFIKGLEGFLSGHCHNMIKQKLLRYGAIFIMALFCLSLYMIPDIMLYGRAIMLAALPYNLLQGAVNSVLALVLLISLQKRYFANQPKS